MTEDAKITQEELREMFGDRLPMSVVAIIFDGLEIRPVHEVRAELMALSVKLKADSDLFERAVGSLEGASCTCDECQGNRVRTIFRFLATTLREPSEKILRAYADDRWPHAVDPDISWSDVRKLFIREHGFMAGYLSRTAEQGS